MPHENKSNQLIDGWQGDKELPTPDGDTTDGIMGIILNPIILDCNCTRKEYGSQKGENVLPEEPFVEVERTFGS